ncbi:Proteasome assembly chaperone 2 [Dinochytrium kinnereticum]|nr:Proteasome assembly chaperone 2 [Dinochytrium kinnereticum]
MKFTATPAFNVEQLKGSTLLLPAPNNIGNLGQLAVDVLLSSLKPQKVGIFQTPLVSSLVGGGAYHVGLSDQLTTSLELFQVNERNLFFVQLRSPVVKGQGKVFAKDFAEWAKGAGIVEVLVVAGADASRRTDSQLSSANPMRSYVNAGSETLKRKVQEMGVTELEKFVASYGEVTTADEKTFPFPPGMGLSKLLLSAFNGIQLQSLFLALYVSEGDNTGAAVFVAQNLSKVLDLTIAYHLRGEISKQIVK